MKTEVRFSMGSIPLASPIYTGPKFVSHKSRRRQMLPRGYSNCFSRCFGGRQRNELVFMCLSNVVLRGGKFKSSSASWTVDARSIRVPEKSRWHFLSNIESIESDNANWFSIVIAGFNWLFLFVSVFVVRM